MNPTKLERFAALAAQLDAEVARDGRAALENTRLGYDGLAQVDMARSAAKRSAAAKIREILS